MIQVDRQAYGAIWALIGIILGAGWVAYGLLGGNQIFLTVMVVLSILLSAGTAVVLRAKRPGQS